MNKYKKRRIITVLLALTIILGGYSYDYFHKNNYVGNQNVAVLGNTIEESNASSGLAIEVLGVLEVKGRAAKTGYARDQFSDGWENIGGCDMRNFILGRDLSDVITFSEEDCTVLEGRLSDPYTGKTIMFERGPESSDDVQIDHVVALSDAWQKGAQMISYEKRHNLANDALNLLAVDGPANQAKGDSDAASWLPPNKSYRCKYVARQIAVKQKYNLWVTSAEKSAMARVLKNCPTQKLPVVN